MNRVNVFEKSFKKTVTTNHLLIENSENKIITQSRLFANEIGPTVLQSRVQQYACCKNAKGKTRRKVTTFYFCPCCLEFLHGDYLMEAGLEHSRSNLVFKIGNNFIFGMLY